ncbi:MAG: flippase-like domain-containing protein [Acidobacteria bacterium]|nr:flippase-like domain-containing protein [Acidobacteriota bacterium]MCA1637270.1 flippase-like domain-containing protein [Acidobacteriota bacterium]
MRKYLKFILLFLFAILIFWFFGRNLNWQQVSQSLRKADAFYITAATLIICLGYLLRAVRWKVLLAPITESSLKELFATTTVGFAAIFLVGRAGEIVRPMWLPMRDKRVRPSAALVTLFIERIFDLAALICFFSINLLWFNAPTGRVAEFEYVRLVGILLLVGVGVGFLGLILYQRFSPQFVDWTEKKIDKNFVPQKVKSIILSILKQLATSLQILKDWREVVSVIFWTFLLWLSIAVPTWFVLLAFDLPLSFIDSLFIMGWAAIGSIVPTPGGAAGAFHAATAGGLIFLNVEREQAAAVSIVMHLVYFAPALFFGIYYFLHGDISVARFKGLLDSEHAVEEIEEGEKGRKGEGKKEVENSGFRVLNRGNEGQNYNEPRTENYEQLMNPKSKIQNPKSL